MWGSLSPAGCSILSRSLRKGTTSRKPTPIQHALSQDAVGAGPVSFAGFLQPGDFVGVEAGNLGTDGTFTRPLRRIGARDPARLTPAESHAACARAGCGWRGSGSLCLLSSAKRSRRRRGAWRQPASQDDRICLAPRLSTPTAAIQVCRRYRFDRPKNGDRRDEPHFVEERLGTKPRRIRDRFGKPARLTGEATAHAETLPRRRRQYPPFVITVRAPGENCQK